MAPYAKIHQNPQGPGDARPTALQIIADEKLTNKWSDRTALITGGSSGIGVETARALHATGARIFITTRDVAKAEKVRADILSSSPSKVPIEIIEMELDSLASVRAGAAEFLSKSEKLNILINNAGVMASPEGKTQDGFELQMGTNHLSHFLLTKLLLPTLRESSSPAFASRVINVSSMGHHHAVGGLSPEVLADLNFEKTPYDPWQAYGRSKLANILHANQIERVYGSDPERPIHAFSLHPGGITTELWRHLNNETPEDKGFGNIWKNIPQGAATTVWCATAAVWEGKPGAYCEDCAKSNLDPEPYGRGVPGYAPFTQDEAAEKGLWKISKQLVGER
ncbi:short-chain dehydrogenase/reductase-like protein [Tothia fuscella]|uniref:Short-chain dehydrogenase/reductase-like protein n=1 Tax=Tothia fuscella TaxID=1048955 RepID=A0A9P4TXT7_9PEZI|nr:short-chain dehydrogenase/reductase-like protein [Tothia fuscella]